MSKEDKFEKIYQQLINKNNEDMEHERGEARVENRYNLLIIAIVILIEIAIFIAVFAITNIFSGELISLFVVATGAIYAVIRHRGGKSKIEKYENDFKEKVIKEMIKSFDEGLDFIPTDGITSEAYNEGEFEKYDRFKSEDLIKGKLKNGSKFEMSEILTEKRDAVSGSDKKYTTVFNGLLTKVETQKPFNSCLYLRKDVKDKNVLVRILSGKLPFDELKFEVDDPKEFEKIFDVYTSEPDIIAKIFTPEIKQMLINFEKDMKMTFEITIKNNFMYIRFSCGKMFEAAKLSKYSLDRETLYKYYSILDLTFELTNKLVELLNSVQYS